MKRSASNALIFLAGCALGSVSTFFAVKRYFEAKSDKEVESVKSAYEKMAEKKEPVKDSLKGEIKGPDTIEDAEPGVIRTKSSYVNSALNNKPPLKDYTKFFKGKEDLEEENMAESESPKDDEEMTDEEDLEAQEDYETYMLNEDHKKAMAENRPPYIIELSDFELTCSHYAKVTLHYYVSDDLIVTDDDEIVSIQDMLGDCIDESGFKDNDEDIMYVRNDRLCVDYEIEKLYTQFPG